MSKLNRIKDQSQPLYIKTSPTDDYEESVNGVFKSDLYNDTLVLILDRAGADQLTVGQIVKQLSARKEQYVDIEAYHNEGEVYPIIDIKNNVVYCSEDFVYPGDDPEVII